MYGAQTIYIVNPFAISPLLREGICLARATWGGGLYASKYGNFDRIEETIEEADEAVDMKIEESIGEVIEAVERRVMRSGRII